MKRPGEPAGEASVGDLVGLSAWARVARPEVKTAISFKGNVEGCAFPATRPRRKAASASGRPRLFAPVTRATMTVVDVAGKKQPVTVGLDSFCSITIARKEYVHDAAPMTTPFGVRACGGSVQFKDRGYVKYVGRDGQVCSVRALVGATQHLPKGCPVLLGASAMSAAGIDLNHHLSKIKTHRAPSVQFVGSGRAHPRPTGQSLRKMATTASEDQELRKMETTASNLQLRKMATTASKNDLLCKMASNEDQLREATTPASEPRLNKEAATSSHGGGHRSEKEEAREGPRTAESGGDPGVMGSPRRYPRDPPIGLDKIVREGPRGYLPRARSLAEQLRGAASHLAFLLDTGRFEEATELGGVPALVQVQGALLEEFDPGGDDPVTQAAQVMDETFLSETQVSSYLERHGGKLPRPKPVSVDSIQVCDEVERKVHAAMKDVLWEFRDVFGKTTGTPKPLNSQPHKIPLKPGAKRVYMSQPRLSPSKNQYLRLHCGEQLRQGLYEYPRGRATNATHYVLAWKAGKGGKDDPNFEIRPCGNYTRANEQIEKLPPPVVSIEELITQHAGATRFFSTDAQSAYHQILLALESRGILALWAGPLGLIQPVRMPFGYINAGTVLHQTYAEILVKELPPEDLKHLTILVDDFLISDVGAPGLLFVERVRRFLQACRKAGISLKAKKTRALFPAEKFAGYMVTGDDTRVAHDSLEPLRSCKPPTNQSEVRRVLGLFQTSARYIKHYGLIARPLTKLTGKVPWQWRPGVEGHAFETLKARVLERPNLYTPRYEYPFWLRVDASDLGKGAVLYQKIPLAAVSPEERKLWDPGAPKDAIDLKMLQPEEKGKYAVHVVRYSSQAYGRSQLAWPIYYKETEAIFWAFKKNFWYLSMSRFPVEVESDHAPTRYLKHSTKGPVTTWAAEMHPLQWRLHVIPGLSNITADALSRSPVLQLPDYRLHGPDVMWQRLLETLPPDMQELPRLWVQAGQETAMRVREVQQWRSKHHKNAILRSGTKTPPKDFDFAIVAPVAAKAPLVCAELFRQDKPFACLVPSDLVQWVGVTSGGKDDGTVQAALNESTKLTCLSVDLTWVLHRVKAQDLVFSGEPDLSSGGSSLTIPATEVENDAGLRAKWIRLQDSEREEYAKIYGDKLATRKDGLMVTANPGEPVRVVVPTAERRPLVYRTHRFLEHRGWKKIHAVLALSYTWPKMRSEVIQWLGECLPCALSKFKLRTAHGLYRPFKVNRPGEVYGLDFFQLYGRDIMVWVDMFSRRVGYELIPSTTAEDIAQALLDEVAYRRGSPVCIYSDAESGLMGRVGQVLMKMLRCDNIVARTWSSGNSIAERHQYILGEYARRVPPDQRHLAATKSNLRRLAFCVNRTVNETHGLAPFAIELGYLPRLPVDTSFAEVPANVDATWNDPAGTAVARAKIATNQALFLEIARQRIAHSSAYQLRRLNAKGIKPKVYRRGELCVIHRQQTAKQGKWKAKHLPQAIGPCRVIRRLPTSDGKENESAWYEVEHLHSKRRYERNVGAMAPFKGKPTANVTQASEATIPLREWSYEDLRRASPVAILEADQKTVSLAHPTSLKNGTVNLHYYFTKGKKWSTARFYLGFQDGDQLLREPPRRRTRRIKPFSGKCKLDPEVIVVTNLSFRPPNPKQPHVKTLSSASARLLEQAGYEPWRPM